MRYKRINPNTRRPPFRPRSHSLTIVGRSSKLLHELECDLSRNKGLHRHLACTLSLAQSAPSIVYRHRAKASKYAGPPSHNNSCLNDIWSLRRVGGIYLLRGSPKSVERATYWQPRVPQEWSSAAFSISFVVAAKTQSTSRLFECSHGLIICDKMEEPWVTNLSPAHRGLELLPSSRNESTPCNAPGSIAVNNASTLDDRRAGLRFCRRCTPIDWKADAASPGESYPVW